jgi:transcriptional regulator with XRE-family HTH domain
MSELGRRIKEARERAGLTQHALAAKLGCAASAVCHWEGGKRQPPPERLVAIANLTFTEPEIFLDPTAPLPHEVVQTRDDREAQMLRIWRVLSERQQDNLLNLLHQSRIVRRQLDKRQD